MRLYEIYVFWVAETRFEVNFVLSRQVFEITSKNVFVSFLRLSQKLEVIGQNKLRIWFQQPKKHVINIVELPDQTKKIFEALTFFKVILKT